MSLICFLDAITHGLLVVSGRYAYSPILYSALVVNAKILYDEYRIPIVEGKPSRCSQKSCLEAICKQRATPWYSFDKQLVPAIEIKHARLLARAHFPMSLHRKPGSKDVESRCIICINVLEICASNAMSLCISLTIEITDLVGKNIIVIYEANSSGHISRTQERTPIFNSHFCYQTIVRLYVPCLCNY